MQATKERHKESEETHLDSVTATLSLFLQRLCEALAHELDYFVFIFEADLLLGRVHVDVDPARID